MPGAPRSQSSEPHIEPCAQRVPSDNIIKHMTRASVEGADVERASVARINVERTAGGKWAGYVGRAEGAQGAVVGGERSPDERAVRRALSGWILPVGLLALWELAARSGVLRSHLLPPPSAIVTSMIELQAQGVLLAHVAATCLRVLAGFVLGALAGTVLGVLTGRSERARALLDPMLQALRSIPSLAWVPLFLLWLGIQEASKIALIAVGAFFPVYLNLMSGIRAIDPRLLEVAEMFQYRGAELARRVLLPAALPAYITGLRSGLGLAWMFVVAAELMGASRGLGYLMVDGQTTSRPELIMGAILLFAALGKLTDQLLARAAR